MESESELKQQSALVHQEIVVLVLLIAIATAAFFFTRWAAGANHARRRLDAAAWYQRGSDAMKSGRTAAGVDALRAAIALDYENTPYRLALANALTSNHNDVAAGQILAGLRALTPEDAAINLSLARIEARGGRPESAIAFYQSALYGKWSGDQAESLRTVRFELIDYLLSLGDKRRALAELVVLSGNVRDIAADQRAIGDRFLRAGDPQRALTHLQRALQQQPEDAATLTLAAEAAFEAGDYEAADRFFRTAPDADATALPRRLTALVLANDPLAPHLSAADRHTRLRQGFAVASARLDACAASAEMFRTLIADATAALSARNANTTDVVDDGLRLMGQIETATAKSCGAGSDLDRAWLLIAQRHGFGRS